MIRPYKGNYRQTQAFNDPCCRKNYFQFNLKGHNGLDIGLPCETKLISPITGTITEVADEGSIGYGKYIKIENSAEGCLLAHLYKQDVQVGQKVDQGQHLGWSGTTGNSTGCHLHLGYFRTPRDRKNGFNGYIDPTPYILENVIIPPVGENMEFTDQTLIPIGGDYGTIELQQVRSILVAKDRRITELETAPQSPQNPPESSDLSSYPLSDLLVAIITKIFPKK